MAATILTDAPNDLTLLDRCDRCGAQAFAIARFAAGELLFCGHHLGKHEVALKEQAYEIVDNRAAINSAPSASSGTEADSK